VELERPTARAASSSRRGPCWVEIDDTSPIPSRARRSTTVARCAALTSVRGANTKAIRGVAGAVMSGACITPPFNCRRPFWRRAKARDRFALQGGELRWLP